MVLMDGKTVAESVTLQTRKRIVALKAKGIIPGLAVILVGKDPASVSYVSGKEKACAELGLISKKIDLPGDVPEEEIFRIIDELNNDPAIHGILVQQPLPGSIDTARVVERVAASKDVDGLNPVSIGRLQIEERTFLPCTPHGIIKMLEYYGISIEGKHAVILGRSNIVGKPMAMLFLQKSSLGNATVTVCHSRSKDLERITSSADILVAAIGKPCFVKKVHVKPGAVVIDVGINRVADSSQAKGYRLVGDVDFDSVKSVVSYITPVPGGVGRMTIAMLMSNVVDAAEQSLSGE
jgi:methylenetetrahydrofolate dehydrogenase (NADP+) / methenyltetrahydrofolate cyclohydrolase